MRTFSRATAASMLLWLASGSAARASGISEALPNTQFDYAIQIFGQDEGIRYNTTTSYSGTLLGSSAFTDQVCHPGNQLAPGGSCASIEWGTHPSPSVTSYLAAPPGTIYNSASPYAGDAGYQNILQADLTYYYEIVGPSPNTPVPVELTTFVKFDVNTPAASGNAYTILQGVDPNNMNLTTTYASANIVNPSGTYVLTTDVLPGHAYFIQLSTGVQLFNTYGVFYGEPTYTANMVADPVLQFAPGFDSTGYSIVFSDGIGNSSATAAPEPASFGLLAAGIGLVVLRRRAR